MILLKWMFALQFNNLCFFYSSIYVHTSFLTVMHYSSVIVYLRTLEDDPLRVETCSVV
jgi:hypothetical protein